MESTLDEGVDNAIVTIGMAVLLFVFFGFAFAIEHVQGEVANISSQNQNIQTSTVETTYSGAVKKGNEYFDGEIYGSELIHEILAIQEGIAVMVDGLNLNTRVYNGVPRLEYYKTVSAVPLADKISDNAVYMRYYTIIDGEIVKINYIKK